MSKALNGLSGLDLLAMAKDGNDDAGTVLLGRYKKRMMKNGAEHPQTKRLAGWLGEILEARRGARVVEPVAEPVAEPVEAPASADDLVAAVLAKRAATPPKRTVRRFSADTIAAYRLVDEHGLTAGEVAEYLGKTEGTVRNAITRVRKALAAGEDILWG